MKKLALMILAVVALVSANGVFADMKIAVVDLQKVIAASPQAQAADKQFKSDFGARDQKLKAAATSLQNDIATYQRNASVMSDKEKQATQAKLSGERDQLQQQQAQFSQDVQTAQATLMKSVFDKIKVVIGNVAQKGGYDMVLQASTVAYYKNTYDITSQVITALK